MQQLLDGAGHSPNERPPQQGGEKENRAQEGDLVTNAEQLK
jgi:hypothetical protein